MARVKRGVVARKRHKKVLKKAKGYYGARRKVFRVARRGPARLVTPMQQQRQDDAIGMRSEGNDPTDRAPHEMPVVEGHPIRFPLSVFKLHGPRKRLDRTSTAIAMGASGVPIRASCGRLAHPIRIAKLERTCKGSLLGARQADGNYAALAI